MKQKFQSRLKTGDSVKVIAGNYKGTIGTIQKILKEKSKVFLNEIPSRVKYKKNSQEAPTRIELQIPIHISNVMYIEKESGLAGRLGSLVKNEEKVRYFKKSNKIISNS
jgi:large subunit ribosomal protein L24